MKRGGAGLLYQNLVFKKLELLHVQVNFFLQLSKIHLTLSLYVAVCLLLDIIKLSRKNFPLTFLKIFECTKLI